MRPRCPGCRQPVDPPSANRSFPFCSERCRLLDLGRWFEGQYRVPGEPAGAGAASDDGGEDGPEAS